MQRFLDPEGLQEPRHRAFRRLGGHLRRSRRHDGNLAGRRRRCGPAAASPASPTCRNSSRCSGPSPTCRRPRCSNLPRPALEGGKPHRRRLPDVGRAGTPSSRSWSNATNGCGRRRSIPRDDNALAITTDGRKLALDARMLSADGTGFPGIEDQRAWSRTSPPSGSAPPPTRGTQMIFCDMGVNPTPWGYSRLRRDHREAGRPRHPPRADRRHRRRRLRRQEAGPVREGAAAARSAC